MKKNSIIKNLIYKDLKLAVHPATIIYFVLAAVMTLIPSYPRPLGFFYILIGVMITFSTDLAYKDREFCSILPVAKRDCVRARIISVCILELMTLIVSIPIGCLGAVISSTIENEAGMNINLTLYAIILLGYSLANIILIPGGYRKNFKTNVRAIFALGGYMVLTLLLENLVCRPMGGRSFLNGVTGRDFLMQLPLLAGAIIVFILVNLLTCRISESSFEKAEI